MKGERPEYVYPYPLPSIGNDIKNIHARIEGDYLPLIIKEIVAPVYLNEKGKKLGDNSDKLIDILIASAPYRQLIEASEKWHEPRRLRRLEADLQRLNPAMEKGWLPLIASVTIPPGTVFNGQAIGGFKFEELTTPSQLNADSEEKGHCVHTYVKNCLTRSNSTHLFALMDEKGRPASTVQFYEVNAKGHVKPGENLTYGNQHPGGRAIAAGNWLQEQINNGRIKQPHTFAKREARRAELRVEEAKRVERIAADPVLLQATFDTVRSAIFPQAWKQYRTPQDFLRMALGETEAVSAPLPSSRTAGLRGMPRPGGGDAARMGL